MKPYILPILLLILALLQTTAHASVNLPQANVVAAEQLQTNNSLRAQAWSNRLAKERDQLGAPPIVRAIHRALAGPNPCLVR